MLRILLCCGGGFSSSYIVEKMKKEIQDHHMNDDVMIEFSPFSIALEKINDFDIVLCCPHLNMYVRQLVEKKHIPIPIYILPPRMYGLMQIEEIYQDAIDVIDMFNQGATNPVHFPGEDNLLRVERKCAYAHTKKL